jgi:hypothetical protein
VSLQRSCCCGEPEICTVCECNTSYAVSGINLSYQFQRYKTNANQSCTCRYYEYNLVLSFTPATAVVVTKVAGGGCCYRGRFTVNVTGFLICCSTTTAVPIARRNLTYRTRTKSARRRAHASRSYATPKRTFATGEAERKVSCTRSRLATSRLSATQISSLPATAIRAHNPAVTNFDVSADVSNTAPTSDV